MALNLYKGYVPTSGKKATMPFKDKTSDELLTLTEAQKFSEYAGILADDTVLVDIDDAEQSKILLNIVQNLKLKCKVLATSRGAHFLFKTDKPMQNRTHCKLAIGLTADIKGGGRASYDLFQQPLPRGAFHVFGLHRIKERSPMQRIIRLPSSFTVIRETLPAPPHSSQVFMLSTGKP